MLSVALVSAYLPVMVLAPLSVLALYQARRYRVNHMVFRGIRFHQTGSAWMYAILTVLWFAINVCTLGLTYPWARASLERYKMRGRPSRQIERRSGNGCGFLKRCERAHWRRL